MIKSFRLMIATGIVGSLFLTLGCTSSGTSSVGYSVYAGYGYPYYGPGWGYPYPCCHDGHPSKPDRPNKPERPINRPDRPSIQPTENPFFDRPRPPSNIGRPTTRPSPRPTPRPAPRPAVRRAR